MIIIIAVPLAFSSFSNLQNITKETNSVITQDKKQLDEATTEFIDSCASSNSLIDIKSCSTHLVDIQQKCNTDPNFSDFTSCKDPRIQQLIDRTSTLSSNNISSGQIYDKSYLDNLNADVLRIVDVCSGIYAPVDQCKIDMINIQSNCENVHVSACDDSRIGQIMNKQSIAFTPLNQSGDIVSQSNQMVSDYLGRCMQATQPGDIKSCSDTANKMINLCNSMQGGIPTECSDPRLPQIVNMGHTANTATSLSVPSPITINATELNIINNQMQTILNECANSVISNSTTCVNAMNAVKQGCSNTGKAYPAYFPVCSDPRLQSSVSSSSSKSIPQSENGFLKMDKSQYLANANPPEYATVSGKVNVSNGGYVTLTITYPYGGKNQLNAYVTSTGIFSSLMIIDKSYPTGIYTVSGNYHNSDLGSVSFTVR